jgi:hypothetical protein
LSIYNFQIIHKPGAQNRADALSHRPDYPTGHNDNQGVTTLPSHLFVKMAQLLGLHNKILATQERHATDISQLAEQYSLNSNNHHWTKEGHPVIPPEQNLLRKVVHHYHDTTTAEHPGAASMLLAIARDYWWPKMKDFIHAYVKGCATCQMTKSNTHLN